MTGQASLESVRQKIHGEGDASAHFETSSTMSELLDDSLFDDQPFSAAAQATLQNQGLVRASTPKRFQPRTPQSVESSPASLPDPRPIKKEPGFQHENRKHLLQPREPLQPAEAKNQDSVPPPITPRAAPPAVDRLTPPSAQRPTKMAKKTEDLLKKAQQTLDKNQKALTDEAIWQGKVRRRSIDAALKALSACTTQLLTVAGVPEAEMLGNEITSFSNTIDVRFEVISSFRQAPLSWMSSLSASNEEHMKILYGLDIPFLSSLLLHVAAESLKTGIDVEHKARESAETFFALVAVQKEDSPLSCRVIHKAASDQNLELASTITANFQNQLLNMWYDRLSKVKMPEKARMMVQEALRNLWF